MSCLVSLVAWKWRRFASLKDRIKIRYVDLRRFCDVIWIRISFVVGRRSESEGRLYEHFCAL